MNIQKIREIITGYKTHFSYIHDAEIYKWRAVKCFQENWDIGALDFVGMLHEAFAQAKNLMDSGQYFPKRMLLKNAAKNPDLVRSLFASLYDESTDLIARIENFKSAFRQNNERFFPGSNSFQDIRAIVVYLCLRYPDRYYFYKHEMIQDFIALIDYPYEPKRGAVANVIHYMSLCEILKAEIIKDNAVIEMHKSRLADTEFHDSSFNILTQDMIYAAVKHLAKFTDGTDLGSVLTRLVRQDQHIVPQMDVIKLKGSFTNYIENEKENKRIGDLGELLVLEYEQARLTKDGIRKKAIHKSKSEGDGLGYDILSYDSKGNEIYIEVKTTRLDYSSPFYITAHELERSKIDSSRFVLYRLFEFNENANSSKFLVRPGDLTPLCVNPVQYKVILNDNFN